MSLTRIGLWLILAIAVDAARADAVVNLCGSQDQAGAGTNLDAAIAVGGHITFACGGSASIRIRNGLVIKAPTRIDGGAQRVTLRSAATTEDSAVITDMSRSALSLTNVSIVGNGQGIGVYSIGAPVRLSGVQASGLRVAVTASQSSLDISGHGAISNVKFGIVMFGGPLTVTDLDIGTASAAAIRYQGESATLIRVSVMDSGPSQIAAAPNGLCVVRLSGSRFTHNQGAGDGGALILGCDGDVKGTDFIDNSATGNGGALHIQPPSRTLLIRESHFTGNKASNAGGAIHVAASTAAELQFKYLTFSGNSAASLGGAIAGPDVGSSRILGGKLVFVQNDATSGGAVYWDQKGMAATKVVLSNNTAKDRGGAVYLAGAGKQNVLSNCLIVGNQAREGGGTFGASIDFINCTIAANSGGGLSVQDVAGSSPTLKLTNTIVLGNAPSNCSTQAASRIVDGGHNLQFPAASCGGSIPARDPDLDGMFVPDYDSPAVGQGDNNVCVSEPVAGSDVFNQSRPNGNVCTIGAIEREMMSIVYRRRFIGEMHVPRGWDWAKFFGRSILNGEAAH